MNYTTPEKMGISSKDILMYMQKLESSRLATHDMILMRGDNVVCEAYWKPFNKDFNHRMYSVTKSFVAIAVGFLEQDGKINLDDEIGKYFPEEMKAQNDKNMRRQTIRNMLMMSTAKLERYWFNDKPDDRVRYYFENPTEQSRPAGTLFQYDSTGSFILGTMVERVTGKTLLQYLREKLFDKIGVSENVQMLKCPGGHTWGDSSLLCTARDLLRVAKFMMNKGKWNGEQILNEEYVTAATSKQIETAYMNDCEYNQQGYGYQIWRTYDNSFMFDGMGCQFAVCVPDKDIVFIYNAENQGKDYAPKIVMDNLFDMIIRKVSDGELPKDTAAQDELSEYISDLKLAVAIGEKTSPVADTINGRNYIMDKNPMGIENIKFVLNDDEGTMCYTNEQGYKELPFGIGKNVFGKFPQWGYADEVGTVASDIKYDSATSAAWIDEKTFLIKVQIIDKYLGILHMHFAFKGDELGVFMIKTAEDFMYEYTGYASGIAE